MSNNCCVSVPPDSSFQVLTRRLPDWQKRLAADLSRSIQANDQTFGHLEEESLHKARALERDALEEAAQKTASRAPSDVPKCGARLTGLTHGHVVYLHPQKRGIPR